MQQQPDHPTEKLDLNLLVLQQCRYEVTNGQAMRQAALMHALEKLPPAKVVAILEKQEKTTEDTIHRKRFREDALWVQGLKPA
jgi:hypothetical protein